MDIHASDIAAEKKRLEDNLAFLNAALQTSPIDPAFPEIFQQDMGLFQDYGWIAESYELCESVVESVEPGRGDCWSCCVQLAQSFLGHMDLSRGRNYEQHRRFFREQCDQSEALLRAHAQMGLAVDAIHHAKWEEAGSLLQESRQNFRKANKPLYDLKVAILQIMLQRILEQHERACEAALAILPAANDLGARAAAPLLLLYSVIAGHYTHVGKRYEAQRYSWTAVQLARALPPSKAAGFAFYQHARGLHALGKISNAIEYLQLAEPVLRVFDPLARIANLMLLFQCYKSQERWSEAEQLLQQLLQHNLVNCLWEDLAELLEEGLTFFTQVFEPEQADSLLKLYSKQAAIAKREQEESGRFLQRWQKQIDVLRKRLNDANPIGYGSGRIVIDADEQRLILRQQGVLRQCKLRKAPGALFILSSLLESHRKHEPLVTRKQLIEGWKEHQILRTGRSGKDPGKTLRRNLDTLIQLGVIELQGKGQKSFICFPPEVQVILLSHENTTLQDDEPRQA